VQRATRPLYARCTDVGSWAQAVIGTEVVDARADCQGFLIKKSCEISIQ
jgi:hypothetical protein